MCCIEDYLNKKDEKAYYYDNHGKKKSRSAHGNAYTRKKEAKEQAKMKPKAIDCIIRLVKAFLACNNIETTKNPKFDIPRDPNLNLGNPLPMKEGELIDLKKSWDTSFLLVFPLSNIPEGYKRGDIEMAVGNYLSTKGVPIIDYYSHMY